MSSLRCLPGSGNEYLLLAVVAGGAIRSTVDATESELDAMWCISADRADDSNSKPIRRRGNWLTDGVLNIDFGGSSAERTTLAAWAPVIPGSFDRMFARYPDASAT